MPMHWAEFENEQKPVSASDGVAAKQFRATGLNCFAATRPGCRLLAFVTCRTQNDALIRVSR
jgi:hypothetical protein